MHVEGLGCAKALRAIEGLTKDLGGARKCILGTVMLEKGMERGRIPCHERVDF